MKTIYIFGGGITGLACAYELLKHGHKVEIIEKSSTVGGLARTESWKGKPIDMGLTYTIHLMMILRIIY